MKLFVLRAALAVKAWPELRAWVLKHWTEDELFRALFDHWYIQKGRK